MRKISGLLGHCQQGLKKIELRTLLVWLFLTGALWSFSVLGSEVREGETGMVDRQLMLILRSPDHASTPIGGPWLRNAMRDLTALGSVTFLTLLTTVFALGLIFHKRKREAITFVLIAIGGQISVEALKIFYGRARPEQLLADAHTYSASFPSGHTTESTAIFLTIATIIASLETEPRLKFLAYIVATILIFGVGFSRVYLGMHWPTDVLAGWFLGSAWALMGWIALQRWPDVRRR